MTAYYRLLKREIHEDGVAVAHYEPTLHAQGVWNPTEQHMAPATGILCRELELFAPRADMRIARLNFDIWGMIWLKPFTVETRVLRAGQTIELLETRMIAEGKNSIVARAWRLQTKDTSAIAGLEDNNIPALDGLQDWDWGSAHALKSGYLHSLQLKVADGCRPGHGVVWMKNNLDMVEGEPTSGFVRLMGMVDTANGVAMRVQPGAWIFPNVDLNINLLRMPQGEWLGFDTRQQFGTDGIGLTSSTLHDELGVFGHSEQTLTIRKP